MDQARREKLASDIPALLTEAASHMEQLSTKLAAQEKRANDMEHELRSMKLARRMEERQLHSNLSYEQKVAQLREATPEKLAQIESGIEYAAQGFRLGATAQPEDPSSASPADPLGDWIMSNNAYGA